MNGIVVVDTNLLLLLLVGSTSPAYISKHKRLRGKYTVFDFELLGLIIGQFSEIVTLPHILCETSSLIRQIENPALAHIQSKLKSFIETTIEIPMPRLMGAEREEFYRLGLTDAVVMHFCGLEIDGKRPTLITADTHLANCASSLGYNVIDYERDFHTP